MEKNRFWELLAKVQSGDATPEEQLELNQHLVSSPDDQHLAQVVNEFWTIEMPGKIQPDADETAARWEKFNRQIGNNMPVAHPTGKVRRMAIRLAGIAAIGLVLIGSIWLWNAMTSSSPAPKNVVSTKMVPNQKLKCPTAPRFG